MMIIRWLTKTISIFLLIGLLAQPCLAFFQQENGSTAQTLTTSENVNNSNINANDGIQKEVVQKEVVQKEAINNDEPLPFMKEQETSADQVTGFGLLMRTLGALLVILGLLVAGIWLTRRTSGLRLNASNEQSLMTVVSTTSIGEKQSLSVVRFGNKTLLIGATHQSIQVLAIEKGEGEELEKETIESSYSVKDLLNTTEFAEQDRILKY